jgi:Putative beta-barrel porin-2, OmpL-like. bbp2
MQVRNIEAEESDGLQQYSVFLLSGACLMSRIMSHGLLVCCVAGTSIALLSEGANAQEQISAVNTQWKAGDVLDQFFQAYASGFDPSLANTGASPVQGTPRRIAAAPLESPPFPSAEWTYGGTPVIGATDGTLATGPFMQAVRGTAWGNFLQRSRISLYGWIDAGFNVSTSTAKGGNAPASYYYAPNTVQLDQAVLYAERLPDENQRDHFDWGFRVSPVFGTDYRYMVAYGWNSGQYIKKNHQYGVDFPMVYADFYLPKVGYGTNVRVGRYISLPDIEAQLAPNNYFFSHSLLYTIDPYTQTGIVASTMLDRKGQWILQYGISAGNDISPFARGATPTFTGCLRYSTSSNNDNVYACVNSVNSGKFAYNNLQSYYTTWYHRFRNPHLHMATEFWYMYENNTPAAGTVTGYGVNGPYGADCRTGTRCTSIEYAVVNYLMYEISPHDAIGLRNEMLDDGSGQRTGYKTIYSEHAVTWNHYFTDNIYVRPELRFEHSYNATAYNDGTARNQFIFAGDLILKY